MELSIFIFWVVVYAAIWLMHRNPQNVVSRAAFVWIGPRPVVGESWARFQLRWASYSFGWFCQFAVAVSVLLVASSHSPSLSEEAWFRIMLFALPLGLGVAALAVIGFLFKAGKAHWLGPNPSFTESRSIMNAA